MDDKPKNRMFPIAFAVFGLALVTELIMWTWRPGSYANRQALDLLWNGNQILWTLSIVLPILCLITTSKGVALSPSQKTTLYVVIVASLFRWAAWMFYITSIGGSLSSFFHLN